MGRRAPGRIRNGGRSQAGGIGTRYCSGCKRSGFGSGFGSSSGADFASCYCPGSGARRRAGKARSCTCSRCRPECRCRRFGTRIAGCTGRPRNRRAAPRSSQARDFHTPGRGEGRLVLALDPGRVPGECGSGRGTDCPPLQHAGGLRGISSLTTAIATAGRQRQERPLSSMSRLLITNAVDRNVGASAIADHRRLHPQCGRLRQRNAC